MARSLPRALLLAAALLACRGSKERVPEAPARPPAAADWSRPDALLALSADDAAARLGSLAFEASATWTVGRGPGSRTVTTTEQHRVRQLAGGDFEVESVVDAGGGEGAQHGRTVIFAGGETFARSRYMPFRARPTDRGQDARRFRDESFRVAGDVAALAGPALRLVAAGSATEAGRAARRFTFALDPSKAAAPPPAPAGRQGDADTKARLELLEGARPLAVEGEALLDDATGAPLRVKLRAAFGVASDPALRAEVDVDARVTALGGAVPAVRRPQGARPDERKPNGPARALEAAGLRERGRTPGAAERAAPEEEPAEP